MLIKALTGFGLCAFIVFIWLVFELRGVAKEGLDEEIKRLYEAGDYAGAYKLMDEDDRKTFRIIHPDLIKKWEAEK